MGYFKISPASLRNIYFGYINLHITSIDRRRVEDIPWQHPLEGTLHLILDQHIVSPCPHRALVLPELKMEQQT